MESESLTIKGLILPTSLVVGGFLVGLIFDRIILTKLRKIAARTKWVGDEVVIAGLRGVIILWFTIAGVYGALQIIPISPKMLDVCQKILLVIVIFSVTIVLAKIAAGFVEAYSRRAKGALPSTTIFMNLTRLVVFAIGILIILQSLGISITPLITALGIGGLAVALALQDTLSNLFAGVQVLISRQVKPGDYIKLESGEKGYVTDISWRNTTIRALPNNMVVIPNSKLASTIITNYYQPVQEMSVLVQVGVSYDSDLRKVEKVTIEVAKEVMNEVEGAVPEFEPFIRYHTFSDFSINFTVIIRSKEFVSQYLIKHEFIKRLHERYKREGIEIPFPIRTVYMKEKKKNGAL
ncbi:MAG: mechanosensitive ion channel protein MscS [bacterium (Candidatus Stahlbacteria) CG08_land_8_20_14_0_20_40_26]|nr:MAG: mechanosensitive ion channel protein MscS [bacterium (Candidatus Stahlbacteria) CG23_combo_of_CG06-09_8_20_14_all_40_9]PIS26352.1 MAG: mechanosensitive ion channel protein MscS [bacterium (Candidatus Stahlbacteria) CG08_land_8_20_14_0_20_40_26]